jgi:NADH dehydrogenase [ubiquinone] 1 alpha subcomplex assembly factor 2
MRRDPPSLEEQTGDVVRQERMKYLAAEADARWEAKPRVMEDVAGRHALPAGEETAAEETRAEMEHDAQEVHQKGQDKSDDPWAKAKAKAKAQGPGEKWQPAAWSPSAAKKR